MTAPGPPSIPGLRSRRATYFYDELTARFVGAKDRFEGAQQGPGPLLGALGRHVGVGEHQPLQPLEVEAPRAPETGRLVPAIAEERFHPLYRSSMLSYTPILSPPSDACSERSRSWASRKGVPVFAGAFSKTAMRPPGLRTRENSARADEVHAGGRQRHGLRRRRDAPEARARPEATLGGLAHLAVGLYPESAVAVLQEQPGEQPRAGAGVRHHRGLRGTARGLDKGQHPCGVAAAVPLVVAGPAGE